MASARTRKRQGVRARDRSRPAPGCHPLLRVHAGECHESLIREGLDVRPQCGEMMRVSYEKYRNPVRTRDIHQAITHEGQAHLRKYVVRVKDAHAHAHLDDVSLRIALVTADLDAS